MTCNNMKDDNNIKYNHHKIDLREVYNEPCMDKITDNVSIFRCLNELHELLLTGSELQTGLVSAISPILDMSPIGRGVSAETTSSGVELVDKIHGLMEFARDNNQRMSEVIKAVRL